MDSMKTGRFIAALRRGKNWTQADLAQRLGVTDKAVSRWETGKGFPDVSLLRPLADTLGCTVNELLCGEPIAPEDSREKADDALLATLSDARRRVRRAVGGALLITGAAVFLWSLLFLGYDTSWVAIYSTLGALLMGAGTFFALRHRLRTALLSSLAVLLMFFALIEARDYVCVRCHGMPPLYTLSITTTFPGNQKVITYRKAFYTVIRYNCDTPEERYVIR